MLVPAICAGQRGKLDVSSAGKPVRAITRDKLSKFVAGLEPRQSYQQTQKWATSFYIFAELFELLRKIAKRKMENNVYSLCREAGRRNCYV